MTSKEDARLLGRHPEFSRQSRRPGIGALAIPDMVSLILRYVAPDQLVDVPATAKQGKNISLPLGRFMRRKLREGLGLPPETPAHVLRQAWLEQMLPLHEMAKKDPAAPSLRAQMAKQNAPYEAHLRFKMKKRREI